MKSKTWSLSITLSLLTSSFVITWWWPAITSHNLVQRQDAQCLFFLVPGISQVGFPLNSTDQRGSRVHVQAAVEAGKLCIRLSSRQTIVLVTYDVFREGVAAGRASWSSVGTECQLRICSSYGNTLWKDGGAESRRWARDGAWACFMRTATAVFI